MTERRETFLTPLLPAIDQEAAAVTAEWLACIPSIKKPPHCSCWGRCSGRAKGGANNGDAVKTVTYNAEVMEVMIVGMHFKIESVTHKDHPAAQAQ